MKNRYKISKNAKIKKSSLVALDIRPKNLCLKFQVNRTKIRCKSVRRRFSPGRTRF